MDLHKNSNTDWCQDDFDDDDDDDDDDINQPGPSGLKHNSGHFVIGGMKFKNIDFIKDNFTDDHDSIVLTDPNGRPYDVLTSDDMQTMTVLDNQATSFGMTKHSQSVMLPEYNSMPPEVGTMVSMPDQYFQNNLYDLKPSNMSQVSNTHSVMQNLSHQNSLAQIDHMSFIPKQSDDFVNNLGNDQDIILETGSNRFLFSENGGSYIEVSLKEDDVLNSSNQNEFYVVPRNRSVQDHHIAQKIVSMDDLSLLSSPKSHHNVELLVNHEELVDDIDTCDIAVVDESQIPLNSQLKSRIDEGSQSVSLDVDHHHSSGFQRMSKETIEKIAEEFVRQPQCVDEDININVISRINPKSSAQIEYWCEDCNKLYQNESNCPIHQVSTIVDLAVQTRARASLPATHLRIMKIKTSEYLNKFGVFARKTIQKHTQFGPLEGVIVKNEECIEESLEESADDEFKYLIEIDKQFRKIDISNEGTSNWMCFVRPAKTKQEQNMIVDQIGDYLYFTTTRAIFQREELFVGYSTFYAHKRGLRLLSTEINHGISSFHSRKPFKPLKTSLELNKLAESPRNNISNKGFNTLKTLPASCKHMTIKRKLSNRIGRNNSQCNVCVNAQNNSRIGFKTKLRSSNSIRNVWACAACDLKFLKRETIIIHNKLHEDELDVDRISLTDTICPECNTVFHQAEELVQHVSMHCFRDDVFGGGGTIYSCYQCDRRYRNMVHLKAHQSHHKVNELKPYKCNMCDKRFMNTVVLTCHVRTHFEGVIYDCPMCRLTFVDLKSLKCHVYSHAVNSIFYCPMCSAQFKTYKLIRKHIRARHHGLEFGCEYCSSSFISRFNLNLQMLSHSDQKDFLCTMCGKQYKRKDKLKIHMNKIHFSKKKPSKTQLKLEAKTMRKAKQIQLKSTKTTLEYENAEFKCEKCLVGFKKRGVFVNHLVSRHPEVTLDSVPSLNQPVVSRAKMYMCLYCDKVYKTNAKRKSHILKNHPNCNLPEKPTDKTIAIDPKPSDQVANGSTSTGSQVHSCQWCYKQYVLKNKLLRHQRAHHYDLLPPNLQEPQSSKKLGNKSKKSEQYKSKPESPPQSVNLQLFTDTDDFELTATDIQLDHPIEPGSIIAIKRPIKQDNSEYVSQAMRDLGISAADDDLNEEQFYRILDTRGDVAYAQAIDAPVAMLEFGGRAVQQALSSCATQTTVTGTAVLPSGSSLDVTRPSASGS